MESSCHYSHKINAGLLGIIGKFTENYPSWEAKK